MTDVVMPGMSGIELAEHMMDDCPESGVVLLSGYTAETLDLDRVIAPRRDVRSKPVTSNATARDGPRGGARPRSAAADV